MGWEASRRSYRDVQSAGGAILQGEEWSDWETDTHTHTHTHTKETWISAGSLAHFFLLNFPMKCPSGTEGRELRTVVLELLHVEVFLTAVAVYLTSCIQLFVTPWTVAHQAPVSMGFPRQEYWSGLLFSFPGESSRFRDLTCASCIGRWILYLWTTREAQDIHKRHKSRI